MNFKGSLCVSLVLLCASHVAYSAYCHGKPSPLAQPNLNEIITDAPLFVNQTENGKLFTINRGEAHLLHVWGTPYQMGFAHGSLLKSLLQKMVNETWAYMEAQVTETMKKVTPEVATMIANYGLGGALDLTYEATLPFTGAYFYEELHGLAEGGNVDYLTLRRIHLIGELTKGACSMFGAWGSATKSTGSTIQLRALDWDLDGPYKELPLVVIYHPKSGNGHSFANVGFVGWAGCLSGMSSTQLAISEIGVSFPDESFGKESRFGVPFTFLMRDVLQFDKTVEDSIARITSADRTCDLILGVGDGKLNYFRGFQYSHSVARVVDDKNLIPVNETWHPQIDNVVYWGMDWLCPGFNSVLSAQLLKYHGNITAENTIKYITAIAQTGDLHIVVSDLTNSVMYVSFAAKKGQSGPPKAFDRPFIKLDAGKLFSLQN